jgi:hypothetical protein
MAQPVKMASLAQEEAAEIKQRNWIYENLQSIFPYLPDVEMGRMCTAVRRGWPRFSHPMSRTPEQFKEAGLRWLKRNKIPHVHFSQEDQIIPPAMEKAGKIWIYGRPLRSYRISYTLTCDLTGWDSRGGKLSIVVRRL